MNVIVGKAKGKKNQAVHRIGLMRFNGVSTVESLTRMDRICLHLRDGENTRCGVVVASSKSL